MKLKVFNVENSYGKRVEDKKCFARITFKSGLITVNKAAVSLLGLASGEKVSVALDEDTKCWYLFKDATNGFVLRDANGQRSYSSLSFNCISITGLLATEIFAEELPKNGNMLIGKEAILDGDIPYWELIVSSFKANN